MVKEKLILLVVNMILSRIGAEDMQKWLKMGVDMLRAKIQATPNKYDDMLLPILDALEQAFVND